LYYVNCFTAVSITITLHLYAYCKMPCGPNVATKWELRNLLTSRVARFFCGSWASCFFLLLVVTQMQCDQSHDIKNHPVDANDAHNMHIFVLGICVFTMFLYCAHSLLQVLVVRTWYRLRTRGWDVLTTTSSSAVIHHNRLGSSSATDVNGKDSSEPVRNYV